MDCEIEERRACGHEGADGKFCSKELETVGDTPGNGTANQSHCGCRTTTPSSSAPSPRPARKAGKKGEAAPNALKSA